MRALVVGMSLRSAGFLHSLHLHTTHLRSRFPCDRNAISSHSHVSHGDCQLRTNGYAPLMVRSVELTRIESGRTKRWDSACAGDLNEWLDRQCARIRHRYREPRRNDRPARTTSDAQVRRRNRRPELVAEALVVGSLGTLDPESAAYSIILRPGLGEH